MPQPKHGGERVHAGRDLVTRPQKKDGKRVFYVTKTPRRPTLGDTIAGHLASGHLRRA